MLGLALMVGSFLWLFVSLPMVSDTWVGAGIAAGPAVLLLAVGNIIFWHAIYAAYLKPQD